MKRYVVVAPLAACALMVNVASAEPARPVATRMTLLPHVTTTFTCGRMSSKACHYLIPNSLCQVYLMKSGVPPTPEECIAAPIVDEQ